MVENPDFPISEYELVRLRKLKEAGFATFTKVPALDALCEEAKAHFGTQMAAVTLLTEDTQVLKARAGVDAVKTPRKIAFCNYTILEDRVFVVLDTSVDPRFSQNPLVINDPNIGFYAGAPLTYLKNLRIGAFCLLDSKPRQTFTIGEKAELVDFAERAVQVLVSQLSKVTE